MRTSEFQIRCLLEDGYSEGDILKTIQGES
jgi:hypothetical protein